VRAWLDVLLATKMATRDGDRFVAAPGLAACATGQPRLALVAELRTALLQSSHMVHAAKRGAPTLGWQHTDAEIVNAQGLLSAAGIAGVTANLFPRLEGLLPRLEAGGAVLDIGAGAAGLTIAFARAFPRSRVVGLEPAAAPLAEARRNVAASEVSDRIELRAQTIEDLTDESAFDFIWLPQMFLPDDVLARGLASAKRALTPGGWLLTAAMAPAGDDLASAAARLRGVLWGGCARDKDELLAAVGSAGFDEVLAFPGPGAASPIVARAIKAHTR
jgi:SAM-dependent methyltransferase